MQVPHNSVVLVVDGRKLLFLRNEGDAAHPNLTVEHAREQDNPATRDQATDAAGQSSLSQGAARSSVEPTDFHQLEEDRFAAGAAELLKKRALSQDYESLIVIAPPKTLGELRKHYHKEVTDRLTGELAKDLTGHPIPDIEKALLNA
ncbi:host attachment family protein [Sphingomonas radiodurans]|uniref:host attachment family protein n=1 Tax=Sphingomonas radiodurans TaxID=2890321 RepID=UPI001E3B70E7|nr:host attachment family protein [Sphingomonas radiodurans]WBH16036.1 host attachment family protein [Sphingomonas radiodurans]